MNQLDPQWIRQPKTPPAHIAYAHKNGRGLLTFEQIEELVKAINTLYVQNKQGKSYLSQHQARAEMNRIFGYGNWSSHVREMRLMYEERMHKDDNPKHPSFPKTGRAEVYWVSGYESLVEVEVRDLWGMPVTSFSEWHAEENAPQPNRGEARALAMTSVESYALRRALIGLGDRLGLGLYNGGSTALHGAYTIQQQPGLMYDWVQAGPDGKPIVVNAAAPAPVTHETIQAEPVISDDGSNPNWVDPEQHQQANVPQQAAPTPQGNGTVAGMQQAAQQQAQARQAYTQQQMQVDPSMAARLQQGFKQDGVQ